MEDRKLSKFQEGKSVQARLIINTRENVKGALVWTSYPAGWGLPSGQLLKTQLSLPQDLAEAPGNLSRSGKLWFPWGMKGGRHSPHSSWYIGIWILWGGMVFEWNLFLGPLEAKSWKGGGYPVGTQCSLISGPFLSFCDRSSDLLI